jgi:hypothetical protein
LQNEERYYIIKLSKERDTRYRETSREQEAGRIKNRKKRR